MPVNDYSTLWWQQQQPHYHHRNTMDPAAAATNQTRFLHRNELEAQEDHNDQKEPLFEKSLTPSDVGKLNRLVIPKQHAEKHFPLNGTVGGPGGDAAVADKGLLLNFEDEEGKCWRFRYSYWNSSQSYVLTKGWSRYVKEKQLVAGNVVFFQRHRTEGGRLFIGWRRRGDACGASSTASQDSRSYPASYTCGRGMEPYHQVHGSSNANPPYEPEYPHAGAAVVEPQTPATVGNWKTLRLFGVNLECQLDDHRSETSSSDGSNHVSAHSHHFYSHQPQPPPHPHYMNISFSGDIKQMGDRRG